MEKDLVERVGDIETELKEQKECIKRIEKTAKKGADLVPVVETLELNHSELKESIGALEQSMRLMTENVAAQAQSNILTGAKVEGIAGDLKDFRAEQAKRDGRNEVMIGTVIRQSDKMLDIFKEQVQLDGQVNVKIEETRQKRFETEREVKSHYFKWLLIVTPYVGGGAAAIWHFITK
ncbi:MAG: hypothetical protein F9K39_14370 [Exiguobacterium chiriqhucha]|uniref:hypothetical protein n=1 Tax=Exiguobacterium chiriqhucha TaxID=1385984 RepID=UPI001450CB2F|nr:hypothetical protein [Exiguobacterium chiriqhucha]KAB2860963.1 MAG: hypothetical protein F9K39_14370 [Exiguobacterium chiriqhucha]